jgi:UDP-glucose 4-epimerase
MIYMEKDLQTILITGGLGQIGYHTYLELKSRYNIILLDDQSSPKVTPPDDVTLIKGKIQDSNIYKNIPDVDFILHCAAQININKSVENPIFDANVNILGTLQLLEYARKTNIERFIHVSSAATYGQPQFLPITEDHPKNPISPYGMSKYVAEQYVLLYSQLYNLKASVVLPFNIYSSLQKENDPYSGVIYKFIHKVKNNESPIIEDDGKQTRDFIHAIDVVKAIELILKNENAIGRIFNVGTGVKTTILELAELVISISGKDLSPKFVEPRKGDIRESYASIKLAKELLGFSPSINLEEGLREIYNKIM